MKLQVESLALGYPGRALARDLGFAITPGQTWAVLGNNGCGKTTLMHALGGLAPPLRGQVLLDGKPMPEIPRKELARRVAVLTQREDQAFWGSVLDYVLLGRHPHARSWFGWPAGDEQIARAHLERMGLAPLAGRAFDTLSGGERQRARIALALTQSPAIYLLDEPLQHLDLKHQLETLRLFRSLARNGDCAVVMVLHDLLWATRYCDHALLLHDDGSALAGPAPELLTLPRLERLFGCALQTEGAAGTEHLVPRDV